MERPSWWVTYSMIMRIIRKEYPYRKQLPLPDMEWVTIGIYELPLGEPPSASYSPTKSG